MAIEAMITEAILEDRFTPVLRRIAAAQDAYSRRTMAMNTAGNVMLAAGAGIGAFVAKSVQVAGQLDEIRKAMTAVEGANQAAFDLSYVDQFAQHSKFTYLDLAETAKRLALQNVNVKNTLGDIADVAAASGKPLQQVAQLYDAVLGGGRVGLGLSARGGFAQYGISAREIFAAAGKPYQPGEKLQNAMTPQELVDAVHKVLLETGRSGLNEKLATTTLSGATGMVQDAFTRLENSVGSGPLKHTIALMDDLAGGINRLATAIKNVPNLGDTLAIGSGGIIVTGGVLKGIAAWRSYRAMLTLAKAAGDAERAGEVAKTGVAAKEGEQIALSTTRWGALRGMLTRVGTAQMGEAAETASASRIMLAGIGTLGLYGVALAGIATIAYEVGDALYELKKAQDSVADASTASQRAISQGYDVMDAKPTGDAARPVWQNYLRSLGNVVTFGHFFKDDPAGYGPQINKALMAKAAKDGMPKNGVRAQMIAAAKAQAAQNARFAAARRAAEAADNTPDSGDSGKAYELPPSLSYALDHAERNLQYLDEAKAGQDKINAARAQELALLKQAQTLYEAQAARETDPKKKYDDLNKADEERYKAMQLGLDKKGRSELDKTIATIIGGGGVGEDEITKMGLNRRLFQELGKGKLPVDRMAQRVKDAAKRPVVVNVIVDGKVLQKVKQEAVDQALSDVIAAVSGSTHVIPGGGL